MRRRFLLIGSVTAAVALIGAAVAWGSTQTITDSSHDSKSDVDLKSASADYDGTTLGFTVVKTPASSNAGDGCIQLKPDWFVGCFKQGKHWFALKQSSGKQFNVKLTHPAKNTILISFPAAKLGHLSSISWRAAFLEEDHPADAIPNKGYKKFPLAP